MSHQLLTIFRAPNALLISLLLAFFGHVVLADAKPGNAQPNPRYPVPTNVSPEAQAILAKPVDMSSEGAPTPKNAAEWHARRQHTEKQFEPYLKAALEQAPIKITKSKMAGVTVRELLTATPGKLKPNRVLMNLHGGGYTILGGDFSVMEGIALAMAGYRVVSVDYRMPPKDPFPAAVDDGVAVYRELLKTYKPENIVIFGSSAGGGLTAAVTIAARDAGLPLPAAVVMHTPWADLSKTGDSYFTNEGVDPILSSYDGGLAAGAKLYAGDADLKHPLVSPVYADYKKGFPPALLSTGTRDLLLSCTVRLHRALRRAGVEAELHVFDAMWHAFAGQAPQEGQELNAEVLDFLDRHLPDSLVEKSGSKK